VQVLAILELRSKFAPRCALAFVNVSLGRLLLQECCGCLSG
jgi:hypothetical protein